MITLELTPEEAQELHEVLTSVVSDLHMEMAGTDDADFREGLKWRAMLLEKLLGQLGR
jgi:hypothetical protein